MKKTIIAALFGLLNAACAHQANPVAIHENFEILHSEGKELRVRHNKKTDTMTVIYNGETLELMPDITASGCSYSSKDYNYTNWHGETALRKNKKIIFSHNPTKLS